ncbi:hypothetical protein pEaSNUABM13_00173 [Erwinia phage pEa_SNUABM_13]|nr:hypothetical protein pEaSNUABM13_00173 [Erwinia phage pEa_SNUABM_13]
MSLVDPLYQLIAYTMRQDGKIAFDGNNSTEDGETFTVSMEAKIPAPDNMAHIDLAEVFAAYPEGFSVQAIYDISTISTTPDRTRACDVVRATFKMRVTKTNVLKGIDGIEGDRGTDSYVGNEKEVQDLLREYAKLPDDKRKQFVKTATILLRGLSK